MSSALGTRASVISRRVVGSIPTPWDKKKTCFDLGVVEDGKDGSRISKLSALIFLPGPDSLPGNPFGRRVSGFRSNGRQLVKTERRDAVACR